VVAIEADTVAWNRPSELTTLTMTTLDEFIRLEDASVSDIRRYIKKWGALGLCRRHGLPHALAPWSPLATDEAPCRVDEYQLVWPPESHDGSYYREPLAGYRTYAKQAVTMVQVADRIRNRVRSGVDLRPAPPSPYRPVDEDGASSWSASGVEYFSARDARVDDMAVPRDWWATLFPLTREPLNEMLVHAEETPRPLDLCMEQGLLEKAVQAWLNLGQVEPRWTWPPNRPDPQLEIGAGHLFGGLAFALALKTTRMARLYLCEDCGKPFTPTRRKQVVRWCDGCRKAASKREQQRRYRARKKAEQDG
jgi:hypothetical protein